MVALSVLQSSRRRPVFAGVLVLVATCLFLYVYCIYSDGTYFTSHRMTTKFDTGDFHGFASSPSDVRDLIFYNKVGKCGSRTLVYLLRKLARRNKFAAAGQSKTPSVHRQMSIREQEQLAKRISSLPRPSTFYRHTYFIDFQRFGYKNPIYINIVRTPLNRFVSEYYFKRFGDDKNSSKNFIGENKYETFDECVLNNRTECTNNTLHIIPYFCGQERGCRNNSRWALDRAKENVMKYFQFVGISEEFTETLKLLEVMFPRFFEGAVEIYKTPGAIRSTKTHGKVAPSPKVVQIMNKRLALENEFYEFIKERFYSLKAKYGKSQNRRGAEQS